MDSSTILIVFIVLLVIAVFAGIGIGLVIGLVLWGRDDEREPLPPAPAEPTPYGNDAAIAAQAFAPVISEAAQPVLSEEPTPDSAILAVTPGAALDSRALETESVVEYPSAPPRAARRTQPWSVALAIGVMLFCCICTFLLAAIAALSR